MAAATARFDVAVAGGGPAGAAAAIALARAGLRVALIQPAPPAAVAPGVGLVYPHGAVFTDGATLAAGAASAVAPACATAASAAGAGSAADSAGAAVTPDEAPDRGAGALRLGESVPADVRPELEALGAWSSFAAASHLASRGTASSWGSGQLLLRDAFCSATGAGWQLDRARFNADLVAHAHRAGAQPLAGHVVAAWRAAGGWSVDLARTGGGGSGPLRLAAGFLVDATGRHAAVARRCGVSRLRLDRLVGAGAVFAWPGGAAPPPRHMLVEAAEQGWWYAARLPRDRAVVCWMSDGDLLRQMGLHRAAPWEAHAAQAPHLRQLLAGAGRVSPLAVVSAASHRLARCAGAGWLAAGDAAAAFDPLSSAGIVLALRSGREAAAAAAAWLGGDACALEAYEQRVAGRYRHYLLGRRQMYALETRFPTAEFWRRRHAAAAALAA